MKRFFIGSLAVVGGLTILFVGAIIALAVLGASSKPGVPQQVVLELELSEPLPEYVPEDSLASAFGDDKLTVKDVVDALEKAGGDARVKGLVMRLDGPPGSTAVVQELRDAVKAFRAKGKKAVAYADTFGEGGGATGAYYLASAFDEIYIQPSGDVSVVGAAIETPFARDALAKLGVKPRMGKRYEYKGAVNTYTEQTYTEAHREETERFLTSLFGQVVKGVAEGRDLSEEQVKAAIDAAPLMGKQAVEAKLVDGLLYRDEVYAKVKEEAGGAQLLYVEKYLERAGRPNTHGPVVALIYGAGTISRGKSHSSPVSGEATMGSETVAAAFRKAVEDDRVKAIVFRVDSPGGGYVPSDTVRREVQRAKEKGKPVIVSMGTYAASGGYFMSMEADKIVAQPGTLTGSIGVYGGKMVTADFWEKLGVNWEALGVGKNATMYSSDLDWTPEQLAKNEASLDRVYEDFTTRAAAGRKLPLEKLQAVARGRVWTGEDAKERGLVDELGGFPVALKLAKEAAKVEGPVQVEIFPRKKGAAEVLAGMFGGEKKGESSDDEEAGVRVSTPWQPLFEQTRALYQLGVKLGVVSERQQMLSAPVPDTTW
ncbi:signal peptide peptidase SppA [Vitiosangium sp. GDMCC 1.1324]|uniref:signal peptide peptidase SppA n=1 Tax=Vitiosangium sp. (strain GDMCC 1.1324) TaxID=2138576 RepID=UPI000D397D3D|nr:signal peptide peptidase SppA [Vitiosangium sp. GDMCC 1.1324]PTL77150.1 signal peptide peptidase SppA [Vitiosangium sp. GDMCC 1.1324]